MIHKIIEKKNFSLILSILSEIHCQRETSKLNLLVRIFQIIDNFFKSKIFYKTHEIVLCESPSSRRIPFSKQKKRKNAFLFNN